MGLQRGFHPQQEPLGTALGGGIPVPLIVPVVVNTPVGLQGTRRTLHLSLRVLLRTTPRDPALDHHGPF